MMFILRTLILGLINGLIFGVVAEFVRVWYATIKNEEMYQHAIEEFNGVPPSMTEPFAYVSVPLLCAVVFSLVSYTIHSYSKGDSRYILLTWQIVGVVALTITVLLTSMLKLTGWQENLISPFGKWLLWLPVVIVINFVYGIIIGTAVTLYSQRATSE